MFIQRSDKGALFLIPVDNVQIANQHGRDSFTPSESSAHVAQVDLPDQFTRKRITKESPGAERNVESLSVRGWGSG